MHDVRQPDGDRRRECPPVQHRSARARPACARSRSCPHASTGSRTSSGIGEAIVAEADSLIGHDTIRVYRVDHVDADLRADRVPGRVRRTSGRRPSTACGSRIGEGLTGWVALHNATIRLGDAARTGAGVQIGGSRGAGVDAPRPDVLRGARAGRHRPVEGGLRPVRRGRPADPGDLRGLRGAGAGQRRGLRPGPPPAAGAAPPAREPAPPARGQRAAPRHARSRRRAGDDRGLPQDRRRRTTRSRSTAWTGPPASAARSSPATGSRS